MASEIAIRVQNLSKCYHIYDSPSDRLKQFVAPRLQRLAWQAPKQYFREFWALQNISFGVKKGEAVGIIGRNGSGKSTLLQMICGTLNPTGGSIQTNGRITALLELGAGFNGDFTGRENIYLNGSILGLTGEEIEARIDDICAFADIGDFIDQPIKTYSSGMFVRLAFSVQVNVDPDILIVDEALSVGDFFFQQKCYAKMRKMRENGLTLLLVSHDTQTVQNICDRAIFLQSGHIEYDGLPEEAVSRYFACPTNAHSLATPRTFRGTDDYVAVEHQAVITEFIDLKNLILTNDILTQARSSHGQGGLSLLGAMILNHQGVASLNIEMLSTVRLVVLIQANSQVDEPSAGIHIYDRFNTLIFAAGTKQLRKELPRMNPGDQVIVDFRLKLNIQAGEYTFSLGCSEPSPDGPNLGIVHDRFEGLGPIKIFSLEDGVLPFYGIAQLPCEVSEVLFLKNEMAKV